MSQFFLPGRMRSTLSWFPGPSVPLTSHILAGTLVSRRLRAEWWCRTRSDGRRSGGGTNVLPPVQLGGRAGTPGSPQATSIAALWRRGYFPQSFTGLYGFVCARIALDDVLQFLRAFVFFSEFEECVSLLELRSDSLISAGKILQNEIVVRDCFLVIAGL